MTKQKTQTSNLKKRKLIWKGTQKEAENHPLFKMGFEQATLIQRQKDISEQIVEIENDVRWFISLLHDLKECNLKEIYPTQGYRLDEWLKLALKEKQQKLGELKSELEEKQK